MIRHSGRSKSQKDTKESQQCTKSGKGESLSPVAAVGGSGVFRSTRTEAKEAPVALAKEGRTVLDI